MFLLVKCFLRWCGERLSVGHSPMYFGKDVLYVPGASSMSGEVAMPVTTVFWMLIKMLRLKSLTSSLEWGQISSLISQVSVFRFRMVHKISYSCSIFWNTFSSTKRCSPKLTACSPPEAHFLALSHF